MRKDNLSPEDRRKAMRAVKGKGTSLERKLFAMLAGMGLSGWQRNVDDMLGKPDVVFPKEHIVIFVDGCFWHGCPHCNRKLPQTNQEYWERKISRNVERDKRNQETLIEGGWRVIRVWGHEMRDPTARAQVRRELRKTLASSEGAE